MRLLVPALALTLATFTTAQSPGPPTLDTLLGRLWTYLESYEPALSTVVADETYDQRVTQNAFVQTGPTTTRRKLESTVSFMMLPGGSAWLGMREVRTSNGKAVTHGNAIQAIFAATTDDARQQAVDLAVASAAHNLGDLRTVNMPTLALEFLHPRNRDRLTFRLAGGATVRGARTTRIEFEERGAPTIIRTGDAGRWVIGRGVIWVQNDTGAIWRAHVFYRDYIEKMPEWRAEEANLEVDFVRDAALGLMVPSVMRELFAVSSGRGQGTATYSNYRRFTTSARIVPQP